MAKKQINNQTYGTAIVDNQGKPTVEFFTLLEALTNLEILDGEGTPEGVETGRFKSLYVDTDEVGNGINFLYFKSTIESQNTGWVLIK